ncbi:MAG: SusF/SusE family outer membrane protein [Prevotellaceae bacterium]|jgi:hypothetical protein|nr:SusF/SusE family outer membrane protein [Prevotellaceae bacterium]
MKKLSLFFGIALLAMAFTSCKPDPGPKPIDVVEDGFYVVGEATAYSDLSVAGANKTIMAVGFNEVLQSEGNKSDEEKVSSACLREGMYEKYVALEGGKPFSLVLKAGKTETKYGAELALSETLSGNDEPAIQVYKGTMTENATLQVAESGLYHIVLDLNLNGDLANKLILIAPVEMGVRGSNTGDGWPFVAMSASAFDKNTITYTIEDQEFATGGSFKFAYGGGWKIQLDADGLVKANTNLGKDMKPGAGNIEVSQAGLYKITLTYTLAQGDISKSFSYKAELTQASDLPTEMYMIGEDFGNWAWESADVVSLIPVNGVSGAFWTVKYFDVARGFKFSSVKAWGSDFASLGTNEGEGYEVTGGNVNVTTAGVYMVYIDIKNNKMAVEPAKIYGMGDCFGGWDSENANALFVQNADGRTLSVTVAAAGNLRIYASSSISTSDWWTREFNIFDGKIEYRGSGSDQATVSATAGQIVTLDFNAGTGSIN